MNSVWFTSDTHFYHNKILDFCAATRRGKDADEMTELMIEEWNKRVHPGDRVYHLGDFSFGSKEKSIAMFRRLKGSIHLCRGNHDHAWIESVKDEFASIKLYNTLKVGDQRFVMMHYPIESWDRQRHGTIHLHGHLHGDDHHECRRMKNRIDVGIDTRGDNVMAPYHYDEVMEKVKIHNAALEMIGDGFGEHYRAVD